MNTTWILSLPRRQSEYEVQMITGETELISSPSKLPNEALISEVREPWMRLEVITPTEFYGTIMGLTTKRRATFVFTRLSGTQPVYS